MKNELCIELSGNRARLVVDTLTHLGVTANYSGFHYITYALMMSLEEPLRLQYVTKLLYPDIAKMFRASVRNVERNIRTVSALAWKRSPDLLCEMAGRRLSGPPTNSEFLAILTTFVALSAEEVDG